MLDNVPDDAHAGVTLGPVETEPKPVLTVQISQHKGEMLLIVTASTSVCACQ